MELLLLLFPLLLITAFLLVASVRRARDARRSEEVRPLPPPMGEGRRICDGSGAPTPVVVRDGMDDSPIMMNRAARRRVERSMKRDAKRRAKR